MGCDGVTILVVVLGSGIEHPSLCRGGSSNNGTASVTEVEFF